MKNPITDNPDQHFNHVAFFVKHVVTVILNVNSIPNVLYEKIGKSYAKAIHVNHSSLLINETIPLEFIHDQSVPSTNSPNTPTMDQTVSRNGCISLSVNKKAYEERLNLCKHSLLSCVILTKGERSWKMIDLKKKLQEIWQLPNWRLISLGKGYFHILLQSDED